MTTTTFFRRANRAQRCFAGPAIDLEAGGFDRRPAPRASSSRLAVQLVAIEADAREVALHRLHVGGAQLGRRRPRRRERLRAGHAVAEMADEQHIQIGEIVFLDHEVIFRGQERRAVDPLRLQQRGRLRLLGGAKLLSRTGTKPKRSQSPIGFVTSGTPCVQSTLAGARTS